MCTRARTSRNSWVRRLILVLPVLMLTLAAPTVTQAHPLGNFTINHYSRLELAPGQVRIVYVLDMAEIPAFQAIQQIDRNDDGAVDADEGTAFASAKAEELRHGLRLALDGTPVALLPAGTPEISFPAGQGGLSLLRLTFRLVGALPQSSDGTIAADYQDTNNPERLGWREIVVQGHEGVYVGQSTVSDRDQSNELRSYPEDMLTSPLNQTRAQFSIQVIPARGAPAPPATRQLGAASNDGAFAALITLPQLDLPVILIALVTALGLGALHALEPGHGKTAAAAYLVGACASARHAVLLGLTITAMHTSSVFVIGIVTLFASRYMLPEQLLPWLGLTSGLIVIALGIHMFLARGRPGASARHSEHHHPHTHRHPQNAAHIDHHSHDHDHHLPSALAGGRVSWRGVLAIGVSGGLLPCPAALVVLLSAIGLGRLGFGMLLIVAFSGGLALVLSGIGLAVLYSSRWLEQRPKTATWFASPVAGRVWRSLPALSSILVIGAGGLLLYHALPLIRVWQM